MPFGTKLRLTYQGRTVVVRVNDIGTGSRNEDRVLDLSRAAMAWLIGEKISGIAGAMLLRYQTGAALSHAEVYAVDAKSVPIVVGKLEGSLIQPTLLDGSTAIEVYEGADLRQPPTCYGWDEPRRALRRMNCSRKPSQP